jgi:DNA repair protein RecO (recombination protein O)
LSLGSRCEAIVLATRVLGEADVLAVLFTAEHGKIRSAARSAKRSRRRFAGGIGGGAVGTAELHPSRTGLWRLDAFTPRLDHAALGRDLGRFAYVAYLCELTDALIDESHPEPPLFEGLRAAIAITLASAPEPLVLRRYELALLQQLGHLPALELCCVCGIDVVAGGGVEIPFDPERGGVLCPSHGRGAGSMPAQVLQVAAALAAGDEPPSLPAAARRRLRDLTAGQLRPHLRHPLRSVAFFTQIAGAGEVPVTGT